MLANVFGNVDGDGFWDQPANWRDEFGISRLPLPADSVFLDRPAGALTVTHRQGGSHVNLLSASSSSLVLAGGSLTLNNQAAGNPISRLSGDFTFSGGELGGALETAGRTAWSGGSMHLVRLFNSGTMTISGAAGAATGTFANSGTINDSAGLSLNSTQTTVDNMTGGTYD